MYYPLVEIPLLVYVVLNFIRIWEEYRSNSGRIGGAKFILFCTFLPIEFCFLMWFRMIFVIKAFDDVKGHTLGFHALMIALCLVALQNFLYHDAIDELAGPRWLSILYLLALCLVTGFKLILAWAIFGGTPIWSVQTVSGQRAMQGLDILWMILGSVAPAILAWQNRKRTPAMAISYAAIAVTAKQREGMQIGQGGCLSMCQ